MPSAAADVRAATAPSAIWLRKIAGIIRYVEPLPIPPARRATRNPTRNSGNDPARTAAITPTTPRPMPTNTTAVIRAPPVRSASHPPSGRNADPTSAPRNA